jgi:hypothetical protein
MSSDVPSAFTEALEASHESNRNSKLAQLQPSWISIKPSILTCAHNGCEVKSYEGAQYVKSYTEWLQSQDMTPTSARATTDYIFHTGQFHCPEHRIRQEENPPFPSEYKSCDGTHGGRSRLLCSGTIPVHADFKWPLLGETVNAGKDKSTKSIELHSLAEMAHHAYLEARRRKKQAVCTSSSENAMKDKAPQEDPSQMDESEDEEIGGSFLDKAVFLEKEDNGLHKYLIDNTKILTVGEITELDVRAYYRMKRRAQSREE